MGMKKVPLTSKSINDLFNLPDVEEDEYYVMMNNINWDFLQQVWFYFVRYSFMPISHISTISMEQMLFLYAILIEKSFNVRKIILKEIHDCAKKKAGSVYFPSLITSRCLRASVKTQENLKG
ncbi:hypothetical protein V6Z12_A07G212000 [Gossypium hirsutum]